jgi:hypothetical protein
VKKLLTLLAVVLALVAAASAVAETASTTVPHQDYTVRLDQKDKQFDVEVSRLDSGLQLWFYVWQNETNTLILTNKAPITYRWTGTKYAEDVSTMSSLVGTVGSDTSTYHLVMFTSTNTTWQTNFNKGFAALYYTSSSGNLITLAQGTHTTKESPEKTSVILPDTADPLNWADYPSHTNVSTYFPLRAGGNVTFTALPSNGWYQIDAAALGGTTTDSTARASISAHEGLTNTAHGNIGATLTTHTGLTTTAHGGLIADTDYRMTNARSPEAHNQALSTITNAGTAAASSSNDFMRAFAGSWKVVYSDGSTNKTELSLGAANTYLKSVGPASAPAFGAVEATATNVNLASITDATNNTYMPVGASTALVMRAPGYVRTNLSLVVGVDVQAYNTNLTRFTTNLMGYIRENDGAGSLTDTDKFDGLDSTDFVSSLVASNGVTNSGTAYNPVLQLTAEKLADIANGATAYTWGDWRSNPSNYMTTNQTITLSGDATGSGQTAIPVTVTNVGTTAWIGGIVVSTLTNWVTQGYIAGTNWLASAAAGITSAMIANWNSAYTAGTNWLASVAYGITAGDTNGWTQAIVSNEVNRVAITNEAAIRAANDTAISNLTVAAQATANAAMPTNGGRFAAAVYSDRDMLTTAPEADELPTAEWVRSLAMQGSEWYLTANVTNGYGEKTTNFVALSATPPDPLTNAIASPVPSSTYLWGGVTTQLFGALRSPVSFEVWCQRVGGAVNSSVLAHPEVYYVYNGTTNHLGDYDAGDQNIAESTTPNLKTWTVSFTQPTITGSVWVIGYLKSGTVSGPACGVNLLGGGVYDSHMDIDAVNAGETAADVQDNLDAHLADTTDAHLASSVGALSTNGGIMTPGAVLNMNGGSITNLSTNTIHFLGGYRIGVVSNALGFANSNGAPLSAFASAASVSTVADNLASETSGRQSTDATHLTYINQNRDNIYLESFRRIAGDSATAGAMLGGWVDGLEDTNGINQAVLTNAAWSSGQYGFSVYAPAVADYTTGLSNWFKMDDNAADTVVLEEVLGANGTATENTSTMTTTNKAKGTRAFDSSAGHFSATCPQISSLTISIWLNVPASVPSWADVWAYGPVVQNQMVEIVISQDGEGDAGHMQIGSPWGSASCGPDLRDTGWHHVAVAVDSDILNAFLDGEQVVTNYSFTFSAGDGDLHVGDRSDHGTAFPGLVDDCRVYSGTEATNYLSEIMTYAPASGGAMHLQANPIAQTYSPDELRGMLLLDTTNTVNTQVTMDISNDGSAWDRLTLADLGPYSGSIRVYGATTNATGTGSNLVSRIITTTNATGTVRGIGIMGR